jgi:hypothetical protein
MKQQMKYLGFAFLSKIIVVGSMNPSFLLRLIII